MASVPWVKSVLYNLLWPVAAKGGKGLACKARRWDTEMVVGRWQYGEGEDYASEGCTENCIWKPKI